MITKDCQSHFEIKRRKILGKEAFTKNNEFLRSKRGNYLKKATEKDRDMDPYYTGQ